MLLAGRAKRDAPRSSSRSAARIECRGRLVQHGAVGAAAPGPRGLARLASLAGGITGEAEEEADEVEDRDHEAGWGEKDKYTQCLEKDPTAAIIALCEDADTARMSLRRTIAAGAVVAGALVAAILVSTLRPDARAVVEAARSADAAPASVPVVGPFIPSSERGRLAHVTRFDPDAHGGHRQSWSVVQAQNGLIYVANSDGVLEYDGTDWRLIEVPEYRARAVVLGPSGTVHVGGEGTAGVLVADSTGRLAYREVVGSEVLDGATVWAAAAYDDGVLFQAFDRLVAVEHGVVVDVHSAPDDRRYHKVFEAGGAAYVRLEGSGLLRYRNRKLEPVRGGDRFADTPVRALFDVDGAPGGTLLAVTDDELFRVEPSAPVPLVPIPTDATPALRRTRAYHGCHIGAPLDAGGTFAITTMGGGALILKPNGQVVENLGVEAGLTPDDLVLGCATDRQQGLWLALSEAVVRVDAASPLTVFDASVGLDGSIYGVIRSGGRFYAGTSRGVYRLRPAEIGQTATFEPVLYESRDVGQAWGLLDVSRPGRTNGALLVAGTAGVVTVDGLTAKSVLSETAFSLASAPDGVETVYVGLLTGLAVLRRTGETWRVVARADDDIGEVRSVFPVDGGAWVAEADGRLLRVTDQAEVVEAFGPSDGVPEGLTSIREIAGSLVVIAADGPFRVDFNGGRPRFTPILAETIRSVAGDLSDGYTIQTDEAGRVWVSGRDRVRAVVPTGTGGWRDVTPPALRRTEGVLGVRSEGGADGVLWVTTTDGLLRLDIAGAGRYAATVPTRVGRIEAGGVVPLQDGSAAVPYGSPVRFRFSAAAFNDPDRTLYRTRLVGHDAGPSPWSRETFRDYTNLPPGDYAFRVEAMTGQGAEARPATVAVRVPAPWYLTPWAAFVAALLAGGGVVTLAAAASQQQRRRADEQHARADELDRLNAELVHADEVKDLMLANTSHELRTPLTAIIGFSEILADHSDEEVSGLAAHMLSGGHRLLNTVNDLLDVARLRSGKVDLEPVETDAATIARDVADELRPLAVRKGLSLVVDAERSVPASLDAAAFARVITNLVSNAVKFTERGGVTVSVGAVGRDVVLDVADTGCGMAPEFLPRLFESFEQESTGYRRVAEGSGLGLSITAHLVELMDGRIDVSSVPGEGSSFRVVVPCARLLGLGDAVIASELPLPPCPEPDAGAAGPSPSDRPDPHGGPSGEAVRDGGWVSVATGAFWPVSSDE